jgi:hypothetical protein
MSTPAATARYVITADDKTKAAIASAQRGFTSMERGIRGTVSRMNLALGLIGGVTFKRALQNVFNETAKGSKEFASALDDVRKSARALLGSKDGAPAATEAMRELAAVLKDPEVVAAADAITSMFIRGAAGTVKFALGVKTLREEIEQLKREEEALEKQEGMGDRRTFIRGEPQFNIDRDEQLARVRAERARKERELAAQDVAARANLRDAGYGIMLPRNIVEAGDRATDELSARTARERMMKAYFDSWEEALDENGPAGDVKFWERMRAEADIAGIKSREAFFGRMHEAALDFGDTMKQTGDDIEGVGNRMEAAMEQARASSVFVEEFQRSMFSNVSGLIQSAGEGWDEFADSAINSFKRILADQATMQLFNWLAGMGNKSGGGSWFGALFGGGGGAEAAGESVGGLVGSFATGIKRVPYDNMPALLHKDEAVLPKSMNPWAGGGMRSAPTITVINQNTFQNMRDVTDAKMGVYAKQISDVTIGRIRELQRKGEF